jgi:CubicO group peptidase (beta-lactamase class C family)
MGAAVAVSGAILAPPYANSSAPSPSLELMRRLGTIQEDEGIPAFGLVLMDEGQPTLVTAQGQTGNPNRPVADADTPFRVGSISKTFTALTAMALVESGELELDTPVSPSVARELNNPWQDTHPVRLVHLLGLTAGLADLSRVEFDNNDPTPLTLAAALALAPEQRRILWPPGSRHSYTNVAPGLTALAIEERTGARFEAVARRRVLEPLDMPDATFLRNAYLIENLPRGYRAGGSEEIPYWHMTYRAFAGLSATPREMSRFLTALLNDGRLEGRQALGARTVRQMLQPSPSLATDAGLPIGYGLGIYGTVRNGFVFYGHGGDGDGFLARFGLLLESGRGYFAVINSDDPPAFGRMRRAIERHLTRDLEPPEMPPQAVLPRARLEQLSGDYYPASTRFRVDAWRSGTLPCAYITPAESGLRMRRAGATITLLPVTGTLFRRPADPLATIVFIADAGKLHMQGELGNYTRVQPSGFGAFIDPCNSQ